MVTFVQPVILRAQPDATPSLTVEGAARFVDRIQYEGSMSAAKVSLESITIANIQNTTGRPNLTTSATAGEIRSVRADTNGGFLRLSSGGGMNPTTQTFLDISGPNSGADSNTVVLGIAGDEAFRVTSSGSFFRGPAKFGDALTIQDMTGSASSSSKVTLLSDNQLGGLTMWLNSTTKTSDGLANGATIQNGVGQLRLGVSYGNLSNYLTITDKTASFAKTLTAESGFTSTAGLTNLGATTTGSLSSTSGTFSSTLGVGGDVTLTNVAPCILFGTSAATSVGAPATSVTRSKGSKIVLSRSASATLTDYAIGLDADGLWNSVPSSTPSYSFRWYGGSTAVMTLDGSGKLSVTGSLLLAGNPVATQSYVQSLGYITTSAVSSTYATRGYVDSNFRVLAGAGLLKSDATMSVDPNLSLHQLTADDVICSRSLSLRAGADAGGTGSTGGFSFEHNTGGYRHWIQSRHNSGAAKGNAIDFFLNTFTAGQMGGTSPGVGSTCCFTIDAIGVTSNVPDFLIPSATARLHMGPEGNNRIIMGSVLGDGSGDFHAYDYSGDRLIYGYFRSSNFLYIGTDSVNSRQFVTQSDERLKDDIRPLSDASNLVKQLRGVRFRWKANGQPAIGLIAQDVEKVIPEVVRRDNMNDGRADTLSVAYSNIVAVLIEAFKDVTARLDALEKQAAVAKS